MTGLRRAQGGQTAVEYAGLLALVATLVLALASLDVPARLGSAISVAVCELSGEPGCSTRDGDRRAALAQRDDPDGDGLSSRRERALGTSPARADSDGDGIHDGREVEAKLDPRSRDTDVDGIQDAAEIRLARAKGTDPRRADTDRDGLLDGAELAAGTNPADADADRDNRGGDPDASGRGDDLGDWEEIHRYGTDPDRTDTDEDGRDDGEEVRAGTNPLVDERSLGAKVGPEVAGILLDDPFGGGKGGAAKKLGEGLKRLRDKLGRKGGREAVDQAAGAVETAARRRRAATDATPAVQAIGKRADEVHEALDPIARSRRTTSVLRTEGDGGRTVDVLAGGARDLSPAQRAAAGPGEVLARSPGEHAEVTAIREATARGLKPRAIVATRDFCPACRRALEEAGADILDPRTAVWRRP